MIGVVLRLVKNHTSKYAFVVPKAPASAIKDMFAQSLVDRAFPSLNARKIKPVEKMNTGKLVQIGVVLRLAKIRMIKRYFSKYVLKRK